MFSRFKALKKNYPSQFWLMFTGNLVSAIGQSMIWPFLMVYVTDKLNIALGTVALIFTVNAISSVIAALFAGPLIDRIGRKWIMVFSMVATAVAYLFLIVAREYWHFILIIPLQGIFSPFFRIAADVTMADILIPEKRADGYALTRIAHNIGVALGPAIGGFLATRSYSIAFLCAFVGLMFYATLIFFKGIETKSSSSATLIEMDAKGYAFLLKDKRFIHFMFAEIFNKICTATIWVMLPVYAKSAFAMPESVYGFLPTTNAVMVLLFQLPVTLITKKRNRYVMMGLASSLYAAGAIAIFISKGFWGLWVAFIIFTLGELILEPTSSTFVADIAPAAMRGRYMGLFGQVWNAGQAVGPVMSGAVADTFGAPYQWIAAGVSALVSAWLFISLQKYPQPKFKTETLPAPCENCNTAENSNQPVF